MTAFDDPHNPGIQTGDRIGDYEVRRTALIETIDAYFYELAHLPTGAKHIHISKDDSENTFSVAYKTVPTDSTGVAHILEHTALCGSKKFPVRDPFFSMIKRSLNTFMNAFTASDWTMYPFVTQNEKDFYNLMDVYLDAGFYPILDALNFKQEGHRMELEGDRLVYKGVVFNEMKGAMSSPDQVMVRSLMNALYPDTTYGNNSGGDPKEIPSLTHEALLAFHRRHYHPSNSFFYTYGNLPLRRHLEMIQEKILDHFQQIDPNTDVPNQSRWSEPREMTYVYPLDPGEDPAKKSQVAVGWLTADIRDTFEVLALSLLGEILLGNPASPLRRALIESGLGSALSDGSGFDGDNRDTSFSCGLKDVAESDASKIEKIIFDVLNELVKDGIQPDLIEAAIHQLEFHRKEVSNSPYPYGIKLLLSFSGGWFHGGDPLRILNFESDIQRLREEMDQGPFFENRIRKHFLDNPHRVLFKLVPDTQMGRREEEREKAELDKIKSELSADEIDRIQRDAVALQELQESEENLTVLPTLELSDIPPSVKSVVPDDPYGDLPDTWWFEQPTSGIFYFTATAGIGTLPEGLVPLLPFFCHAFTKVGTARRDYIELSGLLDLYLGGIGVSTHARNRYDENGLCVPFITLNSKCLNRNQEKMFEILRELLFEFNFADTRRLKTLLMEYRASLEAGVVRSGHSLAISLASRNYSVTRRLNEIWRGVHQLKTIKSITEDASEKRLRALSEDLVSIGKHLFTRKNLKLALIGEDSALTAAAPPVQSILDELDPGEAEGYRPPSLDTGAGGLPREGWATSTAVSFVASAFETVRMGHSDAPALAVIGKMLRSLFLHREIREKGGAYGGFSIYNPEDGIFCMASYRDPHIVNTLKAFTGAADFIRSGDYSDEDIKEAILQVCSDIDRPDPPGQAARRAFYRQLIGLTDETRERFKSRLLQLNRDQIQAAAGKYFEAGPDQRGVAVISNEGKLQAANGEMADTPLALYRI
ncbi:MAG: insulinase family protein [Desulfococcaceae bacterium]